MAVKGKLEEHISKQELLKVRLKRVKEELEKEKEKENSKKRE